MRKVLFLALVGGLVWLPGTGSADPTTTGTWTQYPEPSSEYLAEVRPPLSGANTSNWPSKSKGGIPVMYHLLARPVEAVFQSIGSNVDPADDFAFISFTPDDPTLTFADIHTLSTDYEFTLGDCHGGAIRWSVRTSSTQSLFIYYGNPPQFGNGGVDGCTGVGTGSVDQSGTNMVGLTDLRYDTSQYPGGTFYDTYTNALALMGDDPLIRVSLVLDGGWAGDQRAEVSNTTVNDNEYDFDTGGANGDFVRTCDLPDALIEVTRVTPAPGAFSEASVYAQPTILASDQFRVVDCAYQYVLSIPSLGGVGSYDVEILIDGSPVPTLPDPPSVVGFELR